MQLEDYYELRKKKSKITANLHWLNWTVFSDMSSKDDLAIYSMFEIRTRLSNVSAWLDHIIMANNEWGDSLDRSKLAKQDTENQNLSEEEKCELRPFHFQKYSNDLIDLIYSWTPKDEIEFFELKLAWILKSLNKDLMEINWMFDVAYRSRIRNVEYKNNSKEEKKSDSSTKVLEDIKSQVSEIANTSPSDQGKDKKW